MSNVHTFRSLDEESVIANNQGRTNTNRQILNPNDIGNNPSDPNQNFLRRIFPNVGIKKFLFWVLILNFAMYLGEYTYNRYFVKNNNLPWICTLYNFGAKYTPSIQHKFQIFRLLTPIILHANLQHLLSNSISILLLGFFAEFILSTKRMIILYIFAGFYSSLLSAVCSSEDISVGASGAIMGISGFYIWFYIINYGRLTKNDKNFFFVFVAITLMNLFTTKTASGSIIDIFGHLGGFIGGFLISVLIYQDELINNEYLLPKIKKLQILSLFLIIISITLLITLLFTINVHLDDLDVPCDTYV